jgi:hypothetical protein
MTIKLVPDVAVPAGVFVADWATSKYDEGATGMKLNRPVGIGLAVLGYAGAMLGWGGDAVKNIGIASFDWAANSIVGYIKERSKTAAQATSRMERIPVQTRFHESRTVYPTPGEEVQVTVT